VDVLAQPGGGGFGWVMEEVECGARLHVIVVGIEELGCGMGGCVCETGENCL